MTYGNKYYSTYQNHPRFSSTWTIYIATGGYSGGLTRLIMADEPVFVNFEGVADNIMAPIRASSVSLQIIEKTDNSLIELFEKDRAGLVKIYRDGAMYWTGWTINEYQSPYTMCPKELTITAVDGITFMQDQSMYGVMDASRGVGTYQLITYLYACLNWIGLDLQLYESIDLWADGQSKTGHPLEQLWLPYHFFIKDRDTLEMDTLYDAVEKIMKGLGATLKQKHGRWYIDRAKQLLSKRITYRVYTKDFIYSTIRTEDLSKVVRSTPDESLDMTPINMSFTKSYDTIYKKLTTTVDYKESPNLIKSWLDFDTFGKNGVIGEYGLLQYYILDNQPSIIHMTKKEGAWNYTEVGGIRFDLGTYTKSTRAYSGFWLSENMNARPYFKIRMVGNLHGPDCVLHAQLRLVPSDGNGNIIYDYADGHWYKLPVNGMFNIDSIQLWIEEGDHEGSVSDGEFDAEFEISTWQSKDQTTGYSDGTITDLADDEYHVYLMIFTPGIHSNSSSKAMIDLDLAQLEVNIADGILTTHDIIKEQTNYQGEEATFDITLYSEPNYNYAQIEQTPIDFVPKNDPFWGTGSLMNTKLIYPGMLYTYAGGVFTPVRLFTVGADTTKYMLEYIIISDIIYFYFERRWVIDGTILGEMDIGNVLTFDKHLYMIARLMVNTRMATQVAHLLELITEEDYLITESGESIELEFESSGVLGDFLGELESGESEDTLIDDFINEIIP
jgi:hypothetical protein